MGTTASSSLNPNQRGSRATPTPKAIGGAVCYLWKSRRRGRVRGCRGSSCGLWSFVHFMWLCIRIPSLSAGTGISWMASYSQCRSLQYSPTLKWGNAAPLRSSRSWGGVGQRLTLGCPGSTPADLLSASPGRPNLFLPVVPGAQLMPQTPTGEGREQLPRPPCHHTAATTPAFGDTAGSQEGLGTLFRAPCPSTKGTRAGERRYPLRCNPGGVPVSHGSIRAGGGLSASQAAPRAVPVT